MPVVNTDLNLVTYLLFIIVTYFFMQLLTNKKKNISIVGTILVCCSSCVAWRGDIVAILSGELAILALNKIITSKEFIIKISLSMWLGLSPILMSLGGNSWVGFSKYLFIIYIALSIWVILKNRDLYTLNKQSLTRAIPCILVVLFCGIVSMYVDGSYTIVPEGTESNGLMHLFSYGYSIFLPFVDTGKNIVYSSFLSLFPLSLILAMVYVYKKEKHLEFLFPMIIAIVIESIWCMLQLEILDKILGFSKAYYIEAATTAVSLGCVYLYMYMIANIDENIFSMKTSIRMVLALLVLYFFIPRPSVFMTKGYMYILAMLITLLYFLFINFADKRYQKVLLVVLTIWSLISFIPAFL